MTSILARSFAVAFGLLGAAALLGEAAAAETMVVKPVPRPNITTAAPASTKSPTTAKPAAAAPAKPMAPVVQYVHGRVYVLRGLANVFSRGMDQITNKLKALGVQATVYNHAEWPQIADEITKAYKADKSIAPIILVGHSLGADASLVMSTRLGLNGVPVRLIVTFDGVSVTPPIMNNVVEVINYYKPHGYGQKVEAQKNFTGTITNIDLTSRTDIDHLNIDKIQTLQNEVIAKIIEVLKEKPKVALKSGT